MSLTTLIFFIVVSFFVWRGYRKGFIASVTRILSWLFAYPAAIFFTKPFANFLMQHTKLDGVLVYMLAGCSIFFIVSVLVSLILNLIARAIPANEFTAAGSRFGGATVGLVIGCVLGLLAVYAVDLVKKPKSRNLAGTESTSTNAKKNGKQEELFDNRFSPEDESLIEHSAKKLVSTAASTAVNITLDDKTASQMTKAFAQDPQNMLDHVQQLTNDGQIKQLLAKPEFQAQLNQGNISTLMQNQDFQQLLDNPDMRAIMATSGNDQGASEEAAQKMVAAWQKVDVLKNDPRVLAILKDDAFQQQLNSPNKLQLMMNPKLRELTELIFNSDSSAAQAAPTSQKITRYSVEDLDAEHTQKAATKTATSQANKSEASEQKIYRWTDAEGKVHFSDKPVKN